MGAHGERAQVVRPAGGVRALACLWPCGVPSVPFLHTAGFVMWQELGFWGRRSHSSPLCPFAPTYARTVGQRCGGDIWMSGQCGFHWAPSLEPLELGKRGAETPACPSQAAEALRRGCPPAVSIRAAPPCSRTPSTSTLRFPASPVSLRLLVWNSLLFPYLAKSWPSFESESSLL